MTHRKALVVDDSKSARFALRRFLEGREFDVDTAESADEAYRYLEDHAPEVIFLDHTMPGCDGFDVLAEIKHDPRTQKIPVIICSSNEGQDFARKASDRGALGVLPKPPTAEHLERILSGLQAFSQELRQAEEPESNVAALRSQEAPEAAEAAIEQAVLRAVQSAIPEKPADGLDERLDAIGRQIEQRVRHAGESLAEQIGSLQARVDQLAERTHDTLAADAVRDLARDETDALRVILQEQLSDVRETLEDQIADLRQELQQQLVKSAADPSEALEELRQQIGELQASRASHDAELLQAARASAATEAATVASRTVMNAASKIADRLADSILKALGRQ